MIKLYSLQPKVESQNLPWKENMWLCLQMRNLILTLDITTKKKAKKSNTMRNQFQKPMGVLSKFRPWFNIFFIVFMLLPSWRASNALGSELRPIFQNITGPNRSKIVQTCLNLSKIVQTCLKLSILVKIGLIRPKLVYNYPNLSKLILIIQICLEISELV